MESDQLIRIIAKMFHEHIRNIQEDIRNGRRYIAPVTEKDRAAHQEYLASGGLHHLHGVHPRLPDDGDSDESAGEKSKDHIPE